MLGNMIELHRPTRRMRHIIELVNFHDALYATDEYQNHLRIIGRNLYMHG
jgi:hypothetical protein